MKIDINDYLVNKELTISNEDLDLEKLSKAMHKGYIKQSEADKEIKDATKGMVLKSDYDKAQTDLANLQDTNANLIKQIDDTNTKMARVTLENKLTRKGFKETDFDDIIKIRNSVYADEKDDSKAIDEIAEKFKNTYFPEADKPKFTSAPEEKALNNEVKPHDIKITRKTRPSELLIK